MDYVIIVAGGKGLRMGAPLPKQFLPIAGRPVLMRTLERFYTFDSHLQLILVLPTKQQDDWYRLCKQYHFNVPYLIAHGGATRFESSLNGLALIPDTQQGIVAIHDGVRPFVSADTIARCFDTARTTGAALPVTPVVETLRHIPTNSTVDRADYRLVQTPQCFDIQLVKRAYRQPFSPHFTDDASVVEALGHPVTMTEGNRENIKLTTPFDITVAEALIKQGQ